MSSANRIIDAHAILGNETYLALDASQLLRVQRAYGTPLQQDYATYTYTPNGKRATVKDANGNLSTLEYAKVSLRRPGAQEVIRTLLEYQQPSQAFSPSRVTLRGVEAASVAQLARQDRLELVFEARGPLPTQAWTADIRACAGLREEVHYFEFIF